ncbi:hypothetical protein CH305_18490 [Rhodococcus sp. 15-649-2-2]|uniref:hypothetical protein n=1 Tax=Rhodococcus sp. 15-649-2-2 TaxID=2023140 RepID=UPI000B9BD6CF|nr:hypothetical protein [Rhodococcus sp. 15-649-2-2]OZE77225.1 hypothetical protein CH305_18490 [Rhodococcus sp. 15-649-2-2]
MSTYVDPEKAYVWQDGDAFRAPAGTLIPANPFAPSPSTGTGTPVVWDPFGGIEAGFEQNPSQDTKELNIWNNRKSAYKLARGPRSDRFKMKPVDYSKATVSTVLQGGAITQVGSTDVFRWDVGDSEEFAILLRLYDDEDSLVLYCSRVTLFTPPARNLGGDKIDGWDMELLALSEVVPYTNTNPLAI